MITKTQRKNLMPAFAFRHIKDLYPVFWAKSREMVESISASLKTALSIDEKSGNVVEVGDWASRATLDIIGVAGMGQDFGAMKDPSNKLNQVYRSIFDPPPGTRYLQILGAFLPQWFLKNLPIERNKVLNEASAFIKQTCHDLISSKRAKMEKGQQAEVDIISVALNSGGFTDDDLVNQMMTL